MKFPVLIALISTILLIFSACTKKSFYRISSEPVVIVNNSHLDLRSFSWLLANRLKDLDALSAKNPSIVKSIKNEIYENFIIESLILNFLLSSETSVNNVNEEVHRIRSLYPDDISFKSILNQEGLSYSDWRLGVDRQLGFKKFFNQLSSNYNPTDQEIKNYYDNHPDQFLTRERVFVRQIVSDEEQKINAIHSQISKNSFESLAQKYSQAPEAAHGGSIGWIEKGTLTYIDNFFDKKTPFISEPFETPYGFHIIKIERKLSTKRLSLDEARPRIDKILRSNYEQAMFLKWLDSQIRNAKIFKNEILMNSLFIETRM